MRDSVRALTDAAVGPQNRLDDQAVDRPLADIWWNQDLSRWTAPELSSVISSGNLDLVSNASIRQKLGEWPIKLENVRGTLQRDLDFFDNRQMPLLSELTSLPQIMNAEDGEPGHTEFLYDAGRKIELKTTMSHADVLANRAFQNMLAQRDICLTDILTLAFGGLAEELDETIDLLQEELSWIAE